MSTKYPPSRPSNETVEAAIRASVDLARASNRFGAKADRVFEDYAMEDYIEAEKRARQTKEVR
jgi:hypothetical protein